MGVMGKFLDWVTGREVNTYTFYDVGFMGNQYKVDTFTSDTTWMDRVSTYREFDRVDICYLQNVNVLGKHPFKVDSEGRVVYYYKKGGELGETII